MAADLTPMADYVVVKPQEAATRTASGLYLPDGAQEKSKIAKVVSIGKSVENVKVGDKVIYKNEYEATNVNVGGQEYTVVLYKNIIATVK